MTLKECYGTIGDYQDAMTRLLDEGFMRQVLGDFIRDNSMAQLKSSIENDKIKDAFELVHSMRGVTLNLGLTKLGCSLSELTEELRAGRRPEKGLMEKVFSDYEMTVSRIEECINF